MTTISRILSNLSFAPDHYMSFVPIYLQDIIHPVNDVSDDICEGNQLGENPLV